MAGNKCGPLERMSAKATKWTGTSWAFALAAGIIVMWAVTGPVFGFTDTWQLVINTGTTIVTFLMVFLIQRAQNKDALAIQLKLNELIAAVEGASNRLINVEDLSEAEVVALHQHYAKLVELAKKDEKLTESHSIEDAETDHARKMAGQKKLAARPKADAAAKEPEPEERPAEPAPRREEGADEYEVAFGLRADRLVARGPQPADG